MTGDVLEAHGVSVDAGSLLALRYLMDTAPDAVPSMTALPGSFVHKRRGRGLEVADVRIFEQGDDIRHIDRNATARTGVPHVRTFQDERDRTTLLIADFRAPMLWGTRRAFRSVAAAEQLALIGWRTIAEGGRVGLMALSCAEPVFVPIRGRERAMIAVVGGLVKAHRTALQQQISNPRDEPQPLDDCLRMVEQLAPHGASVVLASSLDEVGPEWETVITALAHRVSFSILHLRDAFEQNPDEGSYPFESSAGRVGLGLVKGEDRHLVDDVVTRLPELGVSVCPIDSALAPGERGMPNGG